MATAGAACRIAGPLLSCPVRRPRCSSGRARARMRRHCGKLKKHVKGPWTLADHSDLPLRLSVLLDGAVVAGEG